MSEPFHPFRQVVENGVDDKPFFQYHDNTACKADYQSCAHNVLASVQKQFDQFVGSPVVGDAGCQSEGEEQGGYLHDIPAISHHSRYQIKNREEEEVQDIEMDCLA